MNSLTVHPDLAEHIRTTPMVDTHEHQWTQEQWLEHGPQDVLADLIRTYVPTDFNGAHCDKAALDRASKAEGGDIQSRWAGIADAWQHIRHTGYGEAMAIQAREIYGIEEITGDALAAAQPILDKLRTPGHRLRLLREVANLDHVQIDGGYPLPADTESPEFFLHDISWVQFCSGTPDLNGVGALTGVEIRDLATYRRAMETIYDRYGKAATGVKSQHAYSRTLRWEKREDSDAEQVLAKLLRGEKLDEADRLCLGDWGWARGVELSIEHGLPFKMHTGFYAGADSMIVDRIRSGHLGPLAIAYPNARLVCMHMAYPYERELIAMAKQFRNIYADMCWAWAMNPYAGVEFIRTYIRAAAVNKLFVFGGDTGFPTGAVGYAAQARLWLGRALALEMRDGFLTLRQAMNLASRVMVKNQYECYPIERARATVRASVIT